MQDAMKYVKPARPQTLENATKISSDIFDLYYPIPDVFNLRYHIFREFSETKSF